MLISSESLLTSPHKVCFSHSVSKLKNSRSHAQEQREKLLRLRHRNKSHEISTFKPHSTATLPALPNFLDFSPSPILILLGTCRNTSFLCVSPNLTLVPFPVPTAKLLLCSYSYGVGCPEGLMSGSEGAWISNVGWTGFAGCADCSAGGYLS